MVKNIFFIIIFVILPPLLTYISQSDTLDNMKVVSIIGQDSNINLIKNTLSIISIIIYAIYLIYLAVTKTNYKNILKQRDCLIKVNKDAIIELIETSTCNSQLDLNIRIFVPKKNIKYYLNCLLSSLSIERFKFKKEFKIKNINYLADNDITENLTIEVEPNMQGLVGLCYKSKEIIYDANLKETNDENYNFTKGQCGKTRKLEFSLCAPIFDNDNVIAVVAFDSNRKVIINKEEREIWREAVAGFCSTLQNYAPDLFK